MCARHVDVVTLLRCSFVLRGSAWATGTKPRGPDGWRAGHCRAVALSAGGLRAKRGQAGFSYGLSLVCGRRGFLSPHVAILLGESVLLSASFKDTSQDGSGLSLKTSL